MSSNKGLDKEQDEGKGNQGFSRNLSEQFGLATSRFLCFLHDERLLSIFAEPKVRGLGSGPRILS
jgi:hypothetical protein